MLSLAIRTEIVRVRPIRATAQLSRPCATCDAAPPPVSLGLSDAGCLHRPPRNSVHLAPPPSQDVEDFTDMDDETSAELEEVRTRRPQHPETASGTPTHARTHARTD